MIRAVALGGSMEERSDLEQMLSSAVDISIVGAAPVGEQSVSLVFHLAVDVVILEAGADLSPSVEVVSQIMAHRPLPILVLVSPEQERDAAVAMLLAAGALEVIARPKPGQIRGTLSGELASRVRLLSRVPVITHVAGRRHPVAEPLDYPSAGSVCRAAVAVAASTGGPVAVARLLSTLPGDLSAPVFLLQHMAIGFIDELACWLRERCALSVKLAASGDIAQAGTVYLGPDDSQMTIGRGGRVVLDPLDAQGVSRPSADKLFESVARIYGFRAIGVVLTGMGSDGAVGAAAIKQSGGRVLAQDESTSTIFGMPRAVLESGMADEVLPIQLIGEKLVSWIGK